MPFSGGDTYAAETIYLAVRADDRRIRRQTLIGAHWARMSEIVRGRSDSSILSQVPRTFIHHDVSQG